MNIIEKFNTATYEDNQFENIAAQTRLAKILKYVRPDTKVLDVACGSGYAMQKIQEKGCEAMGIDISTKALRIAKKKGLNVLKANLEESLPKDLRNKFDIVTAGEIIEHIYDTDSFLQNIRKTLKKDGEIIISTPNIASFGRRFMLLLGISPLLESSLRLGNAGHIRYFTLKTLTKLLNENGFKVLKAESTVVNFTMSGNFQSTLLATVFPSIGSTLIVRARKSKVK